MVATFWADADTRPFDGGHVWYRSTVDPDLLSKVTDDVNKAYSNYSDSEYSLIVTWDHVGYFPEQMDKVHRYSLVF